MERRLIHQHHRRLHCAEHSGLMVVVRGDEHEPATMAAGRAWMAARVLAADPFASLGETNRTSKAWAWWAWRGCEYDPALMRDVHDAHRRMM